MFFLVFVMIGFSQCTKSDTSGSSSPNTGFVEYQYMDTILTNGKTNIVPVFRVFNLSQAYYMVDTTVKLANSLDTLFRPVRLFIYSSGGVFGDSIQPIGSSYVQLSLIDSLKKTYSPTIGLTPYTYAQSDLLTFNNVTIRKPIWLSVQGNMNLQRDSTGSLNYVNTFSGLTTKINTYLNVIYAGNNTFQIIMNGTYNGLSFNIYYTGTLIRRQ